MRGRLKEEPLVQKEFVSDEKVYFGSNGKAYKITGNSKVRKCDHVDDKFIENTKKWELPEDLALQNTNILHKFLRKRLEEVVFKRGYVYHKGYRMSYKSHGFEIVDSQNYNARMNVNKYHNDFATPEDVYTFLVTANVPTVDPAKVSAGEIVYLSRETTPSVSKPPFDKKKAVREMQKALKKWEEKKLVDHYQFRDLVMKSTNRRIRFKTDKLFNKFRKKEMRYPAFKKTLITLFDEMDKEPVQEQKLVRQPKFKGTEFEEPMNLDERGDFCSYEIEGPSEHKAKRISEMTLTHVFMVRELLSHVPKAMTYIMKIAQGEFNVFDIDFKQPLVRDIYVAYDEKILRESKYVAEIKEAVREFAAHFQTDFVLQRKYSKHIQVGDEVVVLMQGVYYRGNVVSTEKGIKVNFEDGNMDYLYQWHYIMDYTPKKYLKG
jgi:hypothetical protein